VREETGRRAVRRVEQDEAVVVDADLVRRRAVEVERERHRDRDSLVVTVVERSARAGDVDETTRPARNRRAFEAVGEDAVGASATAAARDFGRITRGNVLSRPR